MRFSRVLKAPSLDERLSAAVRCFPVCDTGADIGADHGKLACWLLLNNRCNRMIVSDISAKALKRAERLLDRHGLLHRVALVCADGFVALSGDVQAVAVLGMGGDRIAGMLREAYRLGDAKLIVSPQSRHSVVRTALSLHGYAFENEHVVQSAGRFYTVIEATRGSARYSEKELYVGPVLRSTASASVRDYLIWRRHVAGMDRRVAGERHVAWLTEAIEHERDSFTDDM